MTLALKKMNHNKENTIAKKICDLEKDEQYYLKLSRSAKTVEEKMSYIAKMKEISDAEVALIDRKIL